MGERSIIMSLKKKWLKLSEVLNTCVEADGEIINLEEVRRDVVRGRQDWIRVVGFPSLFSLSGQPSYTNGILEFLPWRQKSRDEKWRWNDGGRREEVTVTGYIHPIRMLTARSSDVGTNGLRIAGQFIAPRSKTTNTAKYQTLAQCRQTLLYFVRR